ncbi:MAG: CU044_2847 family protein [Prochloraceae cyanobacterium]|nr:CU044_2847 family protein [Prochloraceae cyanobacterium]
MTQLVQFDLENGNGDSIYVEVDEKLTTSKPKPADDRISRRTDGVTRRATQSLSQALSVIQSVGNEIVDRVKSLNDPADEVTVKFAIKMSAEIGAIVASGNAEANYEITLKWNNKEKNN